MYKPSLTGCLRLLQCAGRKQVNRHAMTQRAEGTGETCGTGAGQCDCTAASSCFQLQTSQACNAEATGTCTWTPAGLSGAGACDYFEYQECNTGDSPQQCGTPFVHRLTLATEVEALPDDFDSVFRTEIASAVTRYYAAQPTGPSYVLTSDRVVVHSMLAGSVVVIFSFTVTTQKTI